MINLPINLYLKTTEGCQLQCKHCYNFAKNNSILFFDEDKTIHFLEQCKFDNTVEASFHGGEPFLCPINKMEKVVEFTKSKFDIYWTATTNLVYKLSDKDIQFIKNSFIQKSGEVLLITSFDYYLRFSNSQELKLWENNVKKLVSEGITVQVIVSLDKLTIHTKSIIDFYEYFKSLGVYRFNFERLTFNGNLTNNTSFYPTNKEVDEWLYKAFLEYEKYNMDIPLFNNVKESVNGNLLGCRARQCRNRVITINADGTIGTCPNDSKINIIGNINDYDEYTKSSIRFHLITCEQNRNPKCYACPYYKYCNGDCCQLKWDDTCPGLHSIYKYLTKR